ncbi:MAG: hypothetical protein AUK35_02375 [Zetaproteobacteria bacterium CG2_30_46_52]|nr:MAG: hypothetical protein AUK35_02375 [Zetaproteobacteria bacterium CG2_30_46_52]
MECIAYKSGYKYQMVMAYEVNIPIKPALDIFTDYINLTQGGLLTIKKGYAWDGPSGPTIDTPNFMRGSLVHDALYQLMRTEDEHFSKGQYRDAADRLLRSMCREDGMSWVRAWWVYHGLKIGGDAAADPSHKKATQHAPKGCEKVTT